MPCVPCCPSCCPPPSSPPPLDTQGGWTPLIWASANGAHAIVQLLLAHGADKEAKSNVGVPWGEMTE